tara:strand:- start:1327 stop:2640 length:1314 start_codon:yes stop_codon:yes gene_type:complete
MSGINQIRTIEDLERATYGSGGYGILKAYGGDNGTTGIHAYHDGTNSGADAALHNLIYGQKVWSMLNREINALAMLPKKPWSSSGWRVLTERALGGSGDTWSTTGGTGQGSVTEGVIGGVSENAAFTTGATNQLSPLAPKYANIFAAPKTIAHQFEISELAAAMAKIDDGIGDIMAAYREEIGVTHAEAMNHMLLQPLEAMVTGSNPATVTGADNNITSLYKIVSSKAELANADGGNLFAGVYTHADAGGTLKTLYGQDRSGTIAWMDAYIDYGDYSGSRRSLTLNMLNTALRELQIRGASPKVILTGYDTIQALGELLQSQERYMGRTEVMPTVNGIKGVKGREVGFKVATYHDIPIIPCKEMASTGSGSGLSDIFILDTDHLHFATLKPTEYFEGGIDSGDPFGVGKLGNRGMYRTIGEVVCTFVKGQGKITNIQ